MVTLNLNSDPDVHSVLTKISAYESPASTPRSICLHTDDRFIGFEKNDDPNTAKWIETKPEKIGWIKYKYQCWQFGIPAIRKIRDCLDGESQLNLSVSIRDLRKHSGRPWRYLCKNPSQSVFVPCFIHSMSLLFYSITFLSTQYYIPKSIGSVYAFEALCDQPEIHHLTRIDMRDCPMTETGCLSMNEFLRRRTPVNYLNLKNNK